MEAQEGFDARAALEQIRAAHQRNLQHLEVQAALYGIATPAHIAIGIEQARAEIARITAALENLKS